MNRSFLMYAALMSVSLAVACSSAAQNGNGATGNGPAATPTPIVTPTPMNMNQPAPASCATNAAGRSPIFDATTGKQIVLGPNQELIKGFPPQFGLPSNAWGLWQINPKPSTFIRYLFPYIPELVGKAQMSIHDESTIAVMPYGTSQQQQLFSDYVKQVVYIDGVAAKARAATINGTQLATPSPQESAFEHIYTTVEQPEIAAESLGTTPDDTDYQNAPGDPNAAPIHTYDYACNYVNNQYYALAWTIETRVLQVTTAYTAVTATLAANKAQPQQVQQVGWVPRYLITCTATNVKPLGNWYNPNSTPPPAYNATIATTYPFKEVARMDLAPLPQTPPPAPATPAPTLPPGPTYVNCTPP